MAIKKFLKKVALAIGLMNMSLGLVYSNVTYAAALEDEIIEETVTQEAKYTMGDDDKAGESEEKAFNKAKRYAAEQVMAIVISDTEVEDFKTKEDKIRSLTMASMKILDRNSTIEDRTCKVSIVARVTINKKIINDILFGNGDTNKDVVISPPTPTPTPTPTPKPKPTPKPPTPVPSTPKPVSVSVAEIDKSKAAAFKGHHYLIVDKGMTWEEAKAACESQGAHLVTISSAAEQKFVEGLLSSQGQRNNYWLGAWRGPDGKFAWIDKTPFNYGNWASGQPDNIRSKALMMYKETNPKAPKHKFGLWNDVAADGEVANEADFFGVNHFGFICEWDS